jgi:hypothetical protein
LGNRKTPFEGNLPMVFLGQDETITLHFQSSRKTMSDTYVLIHGAWHTGELLEPVAQAIRAHGHTIHCPTLAGNRPADDRATSGLTEAVQSVLSYIESNKLKNASLSQLN